MKLGRRNSASEKTETPAVSDAPPAQVIANAPPVVGADDVEVDDGDLAIPDPEDAIDAPAATIPNAETVILYKTRSLGPALINAGLDVPATTQLAAPSGAIEVAQAAVQRYMQDQAEAARFDVVEGNRVLIALQADDLEILRAQWQERNSAGIGKITFSEYLSNRLRICRTHVSTRPVYVDDATRQSMEALFDEVVTGPQDLLNKLDRHIRPIIESPDAEGGIMRLKPIDPTLMELVSAWEPEKSPAEALGDFMLQAALEKAGVI